MLFQSNSIAKRTVKQTPMQCYYNVFTHMSSVCQQVIYLSFFWQESIVKSPKFGRISVLCTEYVTPTALGNAIALRFASSASPVRGEISVENAPKVRKSPV